MRRLSLAALVAAAGVAATVVLVLRAGGGEPGDVAAAWLAAWEEGRYEDLPALAAGDPAGIPEAHEQMDGALRVRSRQLTLRNVQDEGERAVAAFDARLELTGLGAWRYAGELRLGRPDGEWAVVWEPSALHPRLGQGQRFRRTRVWPERAPITGVGGAPLATEVEVVAIGVEPRRIEDRAEVAAALEATVGVDAAALERAVTAPGVEPDHFVPLLDVRPERYEELRPRLYPVPGLVFRRGSARRPVADGFAVHVLGEVGEITAERLEELGDPYQVGDEVGTTGLEAAFERRLAGRPRGEVQVVDDAGEVVAVLHEFSPTAPRPVETTIDPAVQRAAEAALDTLAVPGALVAVDPATGAVRAAASRPLDEGFNRALAGRYAPGSTFKVVTAWALLATGVTPDTPVPCPAQTTVGGRRFRNFEGEAAGTIAFREAFLHSCNTAFVRLAADAGAEALAGAADSFGFGTDHDLPLDSAGGELPEPADTAELAAAAIGQARVTASPLHMATVAAAVAGRAWRPAHLLVGGDGGARAGEGAAATLDVGRADTLAALMRGVVAAGTGTAAAVPGRDVGGKTGTAEFGEATPPDTHAWFIGFSGGVAFAVVAEGGGVGGEVAAPLAARFLSALP